MFIINLYKIILAAHGFSEAVSVALRFQKVLQEKQDFINFEYDQFAHHLKNNNIEFIHRYLKKCSTVIAPSTKLCKVDLSIFEKTTCTAIENLKQRKSIKTFLNNYKGIFDTNVKQIIVFMNIYFKLSKLDNISSDFHKIIVEKHKKLTDTYKKLLKFEERLKNIEKVI